MTKTQEQKRIEDVKISKLHRNLLISELYYSHNIPMTTLSEVFRLNRSSVSRILKD